MVANVPQVQYRALAPVEAPFRRQSQNEAMSERNISGPIVPMRSNQCSLIESNRKRRDTQIRFRLSIAYHLHSGRTTAESPTSPVEYSTVLYVPGRLKSDHQN